MLNDTTGTSDRSGGGWPELTMGNAACRVV
jgi:hypothetical protein